MKQWQGNLIGSIIVFIFGICMFLWTASIEVPEAYETFLGIPYAVNPEYRIVFFQKLGGMLGAVSLFSAGVGILLNTNTIYQLEKKLASEKAGHSSKKCPKCGMKYSGKDYEHCPKCGTKLES